MTIIDSPRDELNLLRDLCGGAVALPGDDGYDAARSGFNLSLDQRPAAVVYPADAGEVADVVRAARRLGLRVAGQSTGHNAGPLGDLTGTVLVKTSGMGGVAIDAANRIARVGAGVLWEDVVDAAAPHGLLALHGSSPTVGVAGYSLGGGMGWLARSHGLQTNSLTAIELVTADGDLVRTDAGNDPDLFWALRGGGGNFGIVTALEFRLYEITEVYAGFMVWDWSEAARVLPVYAKWAVTAPDHVTTSFRIMQLPPLPEIPEPIRGRSIVIIDGAVQGDPAVIEPLRALAPEIDTFATMPAPALVRLHQDPEEPMPYKGDTALIDSLPEEAVEALLQMAGPKSGSPLTIVELRQLGGALGRREPGHGAVGGIDAEFVLFLCGMALDADMGAFMTGYMQRLKAALAPWSGQGHYLNFAEEQVDPSLTHDTDTWARLRAVKCRVDPDNVIHANHAI
ncbi:FAD-binding oxidoreductase [Solirubrobacter ginsenosidimutans]|uniref:FAD-binding oxidoreductase n=1 Tax=Solirubrobacter ginsenosidimutans TaxID=490573 RepID=A0A9X3S4J7_9ACTN|nr:FAD-binding oxidoreductase [Solirubrobacter ginsenosidimutans]MDA0166770.1 FAD-binding oxidoreductase [Solirubrobacter ginsenosidimutans]